MTCDRLEEILIDYLYHELDSEETARFKDHLDGCASCAVRVRALGHVRELASKQPDPEPSKIVMNRIIAHARDEDTEKKRVWSFDWKWPLMKVLVALCLVAVVGGLVNYQIDRGLISKRPTTTTANSPDQVPADRVAAVTTPAPAAPTPSPTQPSTSTLQSVSSESSPPSPSPSLPAGSKTEEPAPRTEGSVNNTKVGAAGSRGPSRETTKSAPLPAPSPDTSRDKAENQLPPPPAKPVVTTIHRSGNGPVGGLSNIKEEKSKKESSYSIIIQRSPAPVTGSAGSGGVAPAAPPEEVAKTGRQALPGKATETKKTDDQFRSTPTLDTDSSTVTADEKGRAIEVWIMEGQKMLVSGQFSSAAEVFQGILKQLPSGHKDRPSVWLWLAQAYEGRGQFAQAQTAYQALAQESPEHKDLAQRRMRALEAK